MPDVIYPGTANHGSDANLAARADISTLFAVRALDADRSEVGPGHSEFLQAIMIRHGSVNALLSQPAASGRWGLIECSRQPGGPSTALTFR